MSNVHQNTWLFLKLYIDADHTLPRDHFESSLRNFIFDVIEPFLTKSDNSDDYVSPFFLRFIDKGFHLRLRAKMQSVEQKNVIERLISRKTEDWFTSSNFADSLKLKSIESDQYVPEHEKYGGIHAMPFIESHFSDSSKIATQLLKISENFRCKTELISLWLCYQTLQMLQLSKRESLSVMSGYANYWQSQLSSIQPNIIQNLAKRYDNNSAKLNKFLCSFNEISELETQIPQLTEIKNEWLGSISRTISKIRELESEQLLRSNFDSHVFAQQAKLSGLDSISKTPFTYLVILPNLIHMLHNRIGVDVLKETQLSYTVSRFISERFEVHDIGFEMLLEPQLTDNQNQHQQTSEGEI